MLSRLLLQTPSYSLKLIAANETLGTSSLLSLPHELEMGGGDVLSSFSENILLSVTEGQETYSLPDLLALLRARSSICAGLRWDDHVSETQFTPVL